MKPNTPVSEMKKFASADLELNKGASKDLIQAAKMALGKSLPQDFWDVYLFSDGFEVQGKSSRIHWLSLEKLAYFNQEEELLECMPAAALFAFDHGEYFFFLDPENFLRHGANAVFSCSMGGRLFKYSQFVARDLVQFLVRVRDDDHLLDNDLLLYARPELFAD